MKAFRMRCAGGGLEICQFVSPNIIQAGTALFVKWTEDWSSEQGTLLIKTRDTEMEHGAAVNDDCTNLGGPLLDDILPVFSEFYIVLK